MTVTLPYPPSLNTMFATVGRRRVLSKKGREYRAMVGILLRDEEVPLPLPSPVCVSVTIHAPDNRRRDLDNIFKAVGDAIQAAGVVINDSDIDELHIVRGPLDRPNGHIVITIDTTRSPE